MRTTGLTALAAATVALAGCGDGVVDETSSEAEIAAAADEIVKPEPGKYETTGELVALELPDMPDAPPQAEEMMRGMMEAAFEQKTEQCITPEEAEQGFARMIEQLQAGMEDGSCETQDFTIDGNAFDATMRCGENEEIGLVTIEGTGGRTSSEILMSITGESPQGAMTMKVKFDSRRVGECDA